MSLAQREVPLMFLSVHCITDHSEHSTCTKRYSDFDDIVCAGVIPSEMLMMPRCTGKVQCQPDLRRSYCAAVGLNHEIPGSFRHNILAQQGSLVR
jgi:hypothetical protein